MLNNNMFDHSKIDFTVSKHTMYQANGDAIDRGIGMVLKRNDTFQPLSIVSEGYQPVNYGDIVSQVEDGLIESGINMAGAEFFTGVFNNGSQLELRAKFPAHEQSIGRLTDMVVPQFVFRTSHNKTWGNNGMVGLWRSMCWNTLVSGSKLAYTYGRHTKGFSVPTFAAKVKNAAEYIAGDGMTQMNNWFDTMIDRDTIIDMFSETLASRMDNVKRTKVTNKVMLSHLMKIFDEEARHLHGKSAYGSYASNTNGSLWCAYNAATHWSSHVSESKSDTPQNVRVTREDRVKKMLASPEWLSLEGTSNEPATMLAA
jgi:hypothetical protein